jgi:hypothetical protein
MATWKLKIALILNILSRESCLKEHHNVVVSMGGFFRDDGCVMR